MKAADPERSGVDAGQYIRENFQPEDRLAVVLVKKSAGSVVQRIASAEKIATPDFLSWLRRQNEQLYEVYLSMNALHPGASGRTKGDIAAIRHVYLDLDHDGTASVEKLLNRKDIPKPNYLISTSPDKWQVVWKVNGFGKQQAEQIQKSLCRSCGGDPAATDCARVLRPPDFRNYKYGAPFVVQARSLSSAVYVPSQFPRAGVENVTDRVSVNAERMARVRTDRGVTQSERDWAYAKRALARGDSAALVAAAIASFRRYDKHNPQDYAARTVEKAVAALRAHEAQIERSQPERI